MACTEGVIEVQTKKCVDGVMVDNPININEFPCNQAVPPFAPPTPPAGNALAEAMYWLGRGLAAGGGCKCSAGGTGVKAAAGANGRCGEP